MHPLVKLWDPDNLVAGVVVTIDFLVMYRTFCKQFMHVS